MSNVFDGTTEGLQEAIKYAEGDSPRTRIHRTLNWQTICLLLKRIDGSM